MFQVVEIEYINARRHKMTWGITSSLLSLVY